MKEKVVLFIGDTIVCAEPFKEFIELEGDYRCLYNTSIKEAKHNIYIEHSVYKDIPRENRPDLVIIDVYPSKMENAIFNGKEINSFDFAAWIKKYHPNILVLLMVMGRPKNGQTNLHSLDHLDFQELKQKNIADHICYLPLKALDLLKEIDTVFKKN
ncbi:MAG: hypothetical protein V1865_02165 [bacterium]